MAVDGDEAPVPASDPAAGPRAHDSLDDEPVPRLPRGRGWRFSIADVIRIAMVSSLLVAVILLQQPCADNVGRFVESFSPQDAAVPTTDDELVPSGNYVRLSGDMSEQEVKEAIERLRDAGPTP